MMIWNQGDAFPNLGKKIIEFDHEIKPGPADDRIVMQGFDVLPDLKGNFVGDYHDSVSYNKDELDAIQTFAVIRYLLRLYEELLDQPIRWSWETDNVIEPLKVYIRNNDINARYIKSGKCIELDYFGPYENWKYYCRSVDIVAHETGHAILDALKPEWEKSSTETRGMIEAFCDLTAMFMITTQKDLCEAVIQETTGNLKSNSILTEFGVGFGANDAPDKPIRTALNCKKYDANYQFTYEYGIVLTGVLYDILIEMASQQSRSTLTANVLFQVARNWQTAIIHAFLACGQKESTLKEFAQQLMNIMPQNKSLISNQFKNRNILH